MKKPANAGAHGLSKDVGLAVDNFGYAAPASAIQVHRLIRQGLTPAVAAATVSLAYPPRDHWSAGA
jgi:hypothetical protein